MFSPPPCMDGNSRVFCAFFLNYILDYRFGLILRHSSFNDSLGAIEQRRVNVDSFALIPGLPGNFNLSQLCHYKRQLFLRFFYFFLILLSFWNDVFISCSILLDELISTFIQIFGNKNKPFEYFSILNGYEIKLVIRINVLNSQNNQQLKVDLIRRPSTLLFLDLRSGNHNTSDVSILNPTIIDLSIVYAVFGSLKPWD